MCADREEAVGSQEVIAAKCCPGHSLAARGGKEKDKVGEWGWREKTLHISESKRHFQESRQGLRVQTSYFRGASPSGTLLMKGVSPRNRLSGEC